MRTVPAHPKPFEHSATGGSSARPRSRRNLADASRGIGARARDFPGTALGGRNTSQRIFSKDTSEQMHRFPHIPRDVPSHARCLDGNPRPHGRKVGSPTIDTPLGTPSAGQMTCQDQGQQKQQAAKFAQRFKEHILTNQD